MITTERVFPGVPGSASSARAWVASVLPGCPVLDDVRVCVSELVTNSILYSRSGLPGGDLTVRAEVGAGSVLVEVIDQGERSADPGHGLGAGWHIIRELAGHCGRDDNRAWFIVTWDGCPVNTGRPVLRLVTGDAR
jgi:Histidine kinase-like ATPase domain